VNLVNWGEKKGIKVRDDCVVSGAVVVNQSKKKERKHAIEKLRRGGGGRLSWEKRRKFPSRLSLGKGACGVDLDVTKGDMASGQK